MIDIAQIAVGAPLPVHCEAAFLALKLGKTYRPLVAFLGRRADSNFESDFFRFEALPSEVYRKVAENQIGGFAPNIIFIIFDDRNGGFILFRFGEITETGNAHFLARNDSAGLHDRKPGKDVLGMRVNDGLRRTFVDRKQLPGGVAGSVFVLDILYIRGKTASNK